MQFWNVLSKSIGPGIVAGLFIVCWDIIRIYIQSKWLVRKLNQKSECPRCQIMANQIKAISDQLGIKHDTRNSSFNKT